MSDYVVFFIFATAAFLIISFPIVLDIVKITKFKESVDRRGVVRRSITLCLIFVYILMQIFDFIFNKSNGISEEFKAILLTVIGYYFGKSTALDDPKK